MPVFIIGGEPGVGKSSQVATIAEVCSPCRWASLEMKDSLFLKNKKIDWDNICCLYPEGHKSHFGVADAFMVDPHSTLNKFEAWTTKTLQWSTDHPDNPPLKTIVVDGVSDIRDYAMQEWIFLDNQQKLSDGRANKLRKSIGEDNLAAWTEVNVRVKLILQPLINYTQSHTDVNLFLTAQMKDEYLHKERVGRKMDTQTWMDYFVDVVIELKREGTHFWADCKKVPAWADEGLFVADLEKSIGLLSVFTKHKLLNV